ncbi:MAG: hypothetical protein ACREN1_01910 [Candidatus Dormibacteria bacterium]
MRRRRVYARSRATSNISDIQQKLREAVSLFEVYTHHSVIQEMLSLRRSLLRSIVRAGGAGNVVLGFDSYHLTPYAAQLPLKIEVGGQTYRVTLDTTELIEIAEQLAGDHNPWQLLHIQNIPLEVTEMQAEPWGTFRSPGNDPSELTFEIERALQVLAPNRPTTPRFCRLSNTVYNLMCDRKRFSDSSHPMVMKGIHGNFTANNKVELEIDAAVDGESQAERVNDKLLVDSGEIDRAMHHYLARGHTG